jgi:hypothetical protein
MTFDAHTPATIAIGGCAFKTGLKQLKMDSSVIGCTRTAVDHVPNRERGGYTARFLWIIFKAHSHSPHILYPAKPRKMVFALKIKRISLFAAIIQLLLASSASAESLRGVISIPFSNEDYYARMTMASGVPTSDWQRVAKFPNVNARSITSSAYQDGIYIASMFVTCSNAVFVAFWFFVFFFFFFLFFRF